MKLYPHPPSLVPWKEEKPFGPKTICITLCSVYIYLRELPIFIGCMHSKRNTWLLGVKLRQINS